MNITHISTRRERREAEQSPEPIRVIRKINGKHQWVILKSEAEMSYNERRDAYTAMFGIYA